MAKKRKFRLTSKQRRRLQAVTPFLLAGLIGVILGIGGTKILVLDRRPANLVWASDKSVSVPEDLRNFLEAQRSCREYRGAGTPTGVGLWGVYQSSQGKFAKIAYGCSWNLNSYIMAVKNNDKWQLLEPKNYFAPVGGGADPAVGALPLCAVIEQYKINKNIEPFCIAPDGTARSNDL